MHFDHFAQAAAANQLAGDAVQGHRAPPGAHLENALVLLRGGDHGAALANVERQGLFRVNVFPRLTRVHAEQHPLEFLRADDDGVDILPFQQLLIMLIDGPLGIPLGLECLGPGKLQSQMATICACSGN